MNYYDTFVSDYFSPKADWLASEQAIVGLMFDDSSDVQYDIFEERTFGEMNWKYVQARVSDIVDVKTGQRNGDDFKKITFKDLSHRPVLGTRYYFSDNVWLSFATQNDKTPTSSLYVYRCNTTIGIEDKYGNVHYEPVYLDYKLNETQRETGETISVPNGRLNMVCQLNKWTKDIDADKRYMAGEDVYKVRYRAKYNRANTYNRFSVGIAQFYVEYDNKGSNDNFELLVADYIQYNYSINCSTNISGEVGATGTIKPTVVLDGNIVAEPVVYQSSDTAIVTVDANGNYTLVDDGKATITASMKNKPDCNIAINVTVGEESTDIYITPDINIIKLNKTITFEIHSKETLNITIETFAKSSCYQFTDLGENKFSIKNLKQSDYPLTIVYISDDGLISGTYEIKLGGIV